MLTLNEKFPDFSLPNQDGRFVNLNEFAGKWLVLYVYPKDDTPGCTLEGREFTAAKPNFEKENISVVGISADDVDSHQNFCNKYDFTIDLLSDTDAELLKKTGVNQIDYNGMKYWERTTFVIDPNGVLRKIYHAVKADGHEKAVLNDVLHLQKEYGIRE